MMLRIIRPTVVLLALVFAVSSLSEAAIRRVARRYNVIDFYGGYAIPHGEYDAMGDLPFTDQSGHPINLGADEWLDETYFLGFDYGTLYKAHLMYMIGFRFTNHRVMDVFETPPAKDIRFRQYDLEFNANYMFNNLSNLFWSPYVGVGAQAGFTSFSIKGADNDESRLNFALSLNFGVDFKIWSEPQKRSFVTLSSINNLNFVGSDDRPIYLNIGGGLRYYFRP
jgi:hypothetical protein